MESKRNYKTIVIGGGAGGLFFCSAQAENKSNSKTLILEKNNKAGLKLLMSGGGQCNLTHGGSIKDFLSHYGKKGASIRSCLYKFNNIHMSRFFETLEVELIEREDQKIFPKSLSARQVQLALLNKAIENGVEVAYNQNVVGILPQGNGFWVTSASKENNKCSTYWCENLVIAAGGCSFPDTGSDGHILHLISKDLSVPVVTPKPALTPVYVENYPFECASGVSIGNVSMKIHCNMLGKLRNDLFTGDILFTHKNLSGPVILNASRYLNAGDVIELNFVYPKNFDDVSVKLKSSFQGSSKEIFSFITNEFRLPKSFVEALFLSDNIAHKKMSSLSGQEMRLVASKLSESKYSVTGLSGFDKAMVTAGGVDLSAVNLKTMESIQYPGLFFIGEVLDVDGDTGGYNLQFAYSSARSAKEKICGDV